MTYPQRRVPHVLLLNIIIQKNKNKILKNKQKNLDIPEAIAERPN